MDRLRLIQFLFILVGIGLLLVLVNFIYAYPQDTKGLTFSILFGLLLSGVLVAELSGLRSRS